MAHEVIAFTREHRISTDAGDAAARVLDLDRAIEQHVRGRVRAVFPEHGFTGEEYGVAPGDKHRWYLDPVDGSTNLANGVPWTSTSLCLTRSGRPVVGVVADPWRGEVLEARRGRGATERDRVLRLDDSPRALAGAVVGTELDGHRPWSGFTAFVTALAARSCSVRVTGSGTLTIAQVAAGRGDRRVHARVRPGRPRCRGPARARGRRGGTDPGRTGVRLPAGRGTVPRGAPRRRRRAGRDLVRGAARCGVGAVTLCGCF
ncbi:inositol monophosphatase family protein [Curtobacterium sp. MCJR17_043]|uniref:inositol monophosphatase family protein n=1 Tax=Curtobacterium sp. MCJR17_043 TaxID=2175660 RepID=UPI0032E8DC4E